MLRLDCKAQNYAWGRLASAQSEVAALVAAAGGVVNPEKPYAELWMGTHPSAPSVLSQGGEELKAWLQAHPEALGQQVLQRFGTDLPFLFKVLSVQTALSIQSHPDKALAQRLHAERPEVYKDDNHKPEMAIAITDFQALCSFVSPQELVQVLETYPELQPCLTTDAVQAAAQTGNAEDQRRHLKSAFTALMTCDTLKVEAAISDLELRLQREAKLRDLTSKEKLILRLNAQYPRDVGVLAAFFLNFLELRAGEAIYLAANEPHAYVSGQIMECMATSDNVIRAGLTPKLRDTEVLCESLTYVQLLPEVLIGDEVQQYTTAYSPPFDEFEVYRVRLPSGASTLIPANQGPSILLVQQGSGLATAKPSLPDALLDSCPQLAKGSVFFIPAKTPLALTGKEEGLEAWIAAVNSRVFAERFALPKLKEGFLASA